MRKILLIFILIIPISTTIYSQQNIASYAIETHIGGVKSLEGDVLGDIHYLTIYEEEFNRYVSRLEMEMPASYRVVFEKTHYYSNGLGVSIEVNQFDIGGNFIEIKDMQIWIDNVLYTLDKKETTDNSFKRTYFHFYGEQFEEISLKLKNCKSLVIQVNETGGSRTVIIPSDKIPVINHFFISVVDAINLLKNR